MQVQTEAVEQLCLLYVANANAHDTVRLIGAHPLDLDTYEPIWDGITQSDWSEDPRLANVKKWGQGTLVSETNGSCQCAQINTLATIARAGYEAAAICWQSRPLPGWNGWRRVIAYVNNSQLAVAFDPRFTVDRIGHDTAALARLSNDLPWQANRREAAILLLERLSGEELSDDLIWGDDEPIGYYLIDQPPPPLNESELSSFLGTM